jgi:TPR repeat protein
VRRVTLITLCVLTTAALAQDRPFWTEKSVFQQGSELFAVGIATGATTLEQGRMEALKNAKKEMTASLGLSSLESVFVRTQMTYEEKIGNRYKVWRLVAVSTDNVRDSAQSSAEGSKADFSSKLDRLTEVNREVSNRLELLALSRAQPSHNITNITITSLDSSPNFRQEYVTSKETWQSTQNLSKHITVLRSLAAKDYDPARVDLALLYQNGTGVERSSSKAAALLKKSADAGDLRASYLLGKSLIEQHQDQPGVKYMSGAAADGYADAAMFLYRYHQEKKNQKESRYFLGKALELGSIDALVEVGSAQKGASGAEKLQRAADLGSDAAKYFLAVRYLSGEGVERSLFQAKRLLQQCEDAVPVCVTTLKELDDFLEHSRQGDAAARSVRSDSLEEVELSLGNE